MRDPDRWVLPATRSRSAECLGLSWAPYFLCTQKSAINPTDFSKEKLIVLSHSLTHTLSRILPCLPTTWIRFWQRLCIRRQVKRAGFSVSVWTLLMITIALQHISLLWVIILCLDASASVAVKVLPSSIKNPALAAAQPEIKQKVLVK